MQDDSQSVYRGLVLDTNLQNMSSVTSEKQFQGLDIAPCLLLQASLPYNDIHILHITVLFSSWLTRRLSCILTCVVCPTHQGVWLNLEIFSKCIVELLIVQLRRRNETGWILELWIINCWSLKATKWWVQAQRDATTTHFICVNIRLSTVLATCLLFFLIAMQK